MAAASAAQLEEIIEALRAVRDADTNLQGLKSFRRQLRQDGEAFLQAYLAAAPEFAELHRIWDHQHVARNAGVTTMLLRGVGEVLACTTSEAAVSRELDALACSITGKRLKGIYRHLGASDRAEANLALDVLTAIATRGPATAAVVLHEFDWEHKVLGKLTKPVKSGKGDAGTADADIRKQPVCVAYARFLVAMLRNCHAAERARFLSLRTPINALFQTFPGLPPALLAEALAAVREKVLAPAAGLPPPVQASAFGDIGLMQLAALAARDADVASEASAPEAAVSQTAYDVLLQLATDERHGLAEAHPAGASADAGSPQTGRRRLLRMLQHLQARSVPRHAQLLLAVCRASPQLASAFLAACSWPLEPQLSVQWSTGVTLLGQLSIAAAAAQPLQLAAFAARGLPPPAFEGATVRALLRCIVPPPLTKAALSHGLQHENALVRYVMLCALCTACSALQPLLTELSAATDLASAADAAEGVPRHAGSGAGGSAAADAAAAAAAAATTAAGKPSSRRGAWVAWGGRLAAWLRARLPEPQVLMALHAAMEAQEAHKPGADTQADGAAASPGAGSRADDAPNAAEAEGEDAEENADERVPALDGDASLGSLKLLAAIAAYQRCLPGAMADARIDIGRLVPADPLLLSVPRQQALVEVLAAAAAPLGPPSSTIGGGAAINWAAGGIAPGLPRFASGTALAGVPLLPLLQLASGSPSAGVRTVACDVAASKLEASGATDGFGCTCGEAALWLGMLPQLRTGSLEQQTCVAAIHSFLAEAVAITVRRPYESLEQVQQLLSVTQLAEARGAGTGFSGLAVTVLRRVLRVAASAKMAPDAKTAVASYAARVLCGILRLQAHTAPFANVCRHILEDSPLLSGGGDGAEGHAAAAEAQPLLSLHHLALAALGAGLEDTSPPPVKRRKKRHGAAAAAETSDAGVGAMLLSSLQSCEDRLQFAQALLRAPRRTLQGVLGDLPIMCSRRFGGDQAPVFGAAGAHGLELLTAGAPLLVALPALCRSEDAWDLPTTAAVIDQWVARPAAKPLVARAAAAALTHATKPRIVAGLFGLLRRCLQVPAESDEPHLRGATDALSAVLPQPSLQQGFLTAADPAGLSVHTVKLVAEVLRTAAAAGRGTGASAGSTALWAVTARRLCQPYVAKLERVLESTDALCSPATLQAAAAVAEHISCSALASAAARALSGCDGKDEDHVALALQLAHAVMRRSAAIGHAAPDTSASRQRDHDFLKAVTPHGAAVVRAAAQLLLRSQSPAVEAALAAWLAAPPSGLLTQPSSWLGEGAPPLLELCMRRSTPAAGAIAAVLVDQQPGCRARFRGLLTSSGARESLPGQQQSPLALLPAAAAYMEHGLQAGLCDGGPAAIAAALQQPVLEHIMTGNLHVPGSSAAARLAADAAAVSAAVAALRIAPPSAEERRHLLQRLVPAGGWLLGHAAAAAAAHAKATTEAAVLAAARQAACAAAIITELPQEDAGAALQETVALALVASETLQAVYSVSEQSSLQQQLEAMLTGLLGGALVQRLQQAFRSLSGGPSSGKVPGAAAGLLSAVDGLAAATLRHRLAAPPALALLCRLLEVLTVAAGFKGWDGGSSAAALTAKHFELLMAHSRLPALLLGPGSDAAAALPASAEAAVAPLASLLPLADGLSLLLPQGAAPSEAAQQKESVAELAAWLLQAHAAASCASDSRTVDTAAFAASAAAALPLLLAAYGATMSHADRELLAAVRTIDRLTAAGSGGAGSQLLASTGCLWGATALEAHRRKLLVPPTTGASNGGESKPNNQRAAHGVWPAATRSMNAPAVAAGKMSNTADSAADQRRQVVQRLLAEVPPVDVRHAALAAVAPRHPAAYDPSFVMPFAAQALQSRVMDLGTFSSSGLLAICLASLSTEDPSVRAQAAEALQVLSAALHDPASLPKWLQPLAPLAPILHTALAPEPAASAAAAGSETAAAAAADAENSRAAAAGDAEDAAMQEADADGGAAGPVSGVSGLSRAPRRLPAVTALLLAEAATQLVAPTHSKAGMARRLDRLLSSRPDLNLEELPLLHAELSGGTPRHAADRAWLLRLLAAGLQGQQDFQVYRKRFVLELLMAVQDSPVADGEARALALGTLCRAARIPTAARDLAIHAGFIPWLASTATAATATALQAEGHATATAPWSAATTASAAALAAADTVDALTALVNDPAVARQLEQSAQADQAADAARALCRVLCTAGRSEQTFGAVLLWRSALRLLVAALDVTKDRRHCGFTGAVLQAQELAQLLRHAPGGRPAAGAADAEDGSGPAAAAAAAAADVQQLLIRVLLLMLPREAVGAAASLAGSGTGGQADDVAFRHIANWAAAAAAACRPHRWASLSAATDAGASVSAATRVAAAVPLLSQLLPLGMRSDGGQLHCDEAVAAGLTAWFAECATAPAVELS